MANWLHNIRHIGFPAALGAAYDTALEWFQGRDVYKMPWSETDFNPGAQSMLIDSGSFPGTISLGTTSSNNNGWHAAALVGAVGTAATTNISDSDNRLTNEVEIRYSGTHDPVLDGSNRKIYGLLQADSTVTDGDTVGAAAAENLQVSFFVYASDGTVTLTSISGDLIEIALPKLRRRMNLPNYRKAGTAPVADVIATSAATILVRKYVVTSPFAENEIMTISTGTGSISGAATPSNNVIASIGDDAGDFIGENSTRVRINGQQLTKTTDLYESSTSIKHPVALDIGDFIEVEII